MARNESLSQHVANESNSTKAYSSVNRHVPIDARFGARVRDLRKERQWTQLYMATHLGIDRSHISDVERGRKSMTLSLIAVVALGFEISVSELLDHL
ncbi:MAG: helix-turn-helix transcriptional regulator [Acidobacteriaceae bacterium]|nr:helix-turn-helix transcriptional regulator [Acidobacteriaceae bacterium]